MELEVKIIYNKNEFISIAIINNEIIGKCDYEIIDGKWQINHTIVKEEFSGKGIAKKLVLSIIEEARKENIKIIPNCSYAKKILEMDEYKDLI